MSLFLPEIAVKHVMDIDYNLLQRFGIKGLVLDVDNTLTTHGHPEPSQGVIEWLEQMRRDGIQLMILSNNTTERVQPFAKKLGLEFISRACKPIPIGLNKAVKKFGLQKDQVALVGDQIYTDILGANLGKTHSILVEPFLPEDGILFRLKRKLEQPWLNKYKKKGN